MASDVGIVNAALQLIKHSKQIASLTSGTKEANAAEVVFDEMRDLLLDLHHWNWATKRVQLARLGSETPAFQWDFFHQLPNDFIRAISLHNNSDARDYLPFSIEGDKVASDAEDVFLRYIARETDPNKMPPSFRRAFTKLLASQLATALAQSVSLSKELYTQFEDQDLPAAKTVDAVQNFPEDLPESDWLTVRNGGQRYYVPGDPPA